MVRFFAYLSTNRTNDESVLTFFIEQMKKNQSEMVDFFFDIIYNETKYK